MAKKKQLQIDPVSGELSRLSSKDLPLIALDGLHDGDTVLPFGSSPSDIIEYCVYDTGDNYLASGEIESPLPTELDIGAHIRQLGYERGTYKVVYNFLRKIGGSSKVVLTKKSDKSIYLGQFMIETNGKIFASHSPTPDVEIPLIDENGESIELLVQDDKFWIQEISPSRTEIRLRPNPAIVDMDAYEKFRLLGFTCLSYSDISGESYITFSNGGKVATINNGSISLSQSMVGGTLKIRDAFLIDYDNIDEVITRYTPVVDTIPIPAIQNLVTNGHFSDIDSDGVGNNIGEFVKKSDSTGIIQDFPNPGNSRYVLRSDGSTGETNDYWIQLRGIPGESYILSCWVHWSDDWIAHKLLFRGSTAPGGTPRTFDDTDRGVAETKEIDGRLWQRLYKNITIPTTSTDGNLLIWLGHTNEITDYGIGAYRYITNLQVEAGSVNGEPSPFVITERIEESDAPVTGLIRFIEDNKVQTILSNADSGFTTPMIDGKITIKDAYVVDQSYTQNEQLVVIDDIPLKNPDGSDIRNNEREFRVSPYHGTGADNFITLQVDNEFDLFATISGNESLIGSGTDWRTSQTFDLPSNIQSLRLEARNGGGPAGFIAKIIYDGKEIKTGDGSIEYGGESKDWSRRDLSDEVDVPPRVSRTGPWTITSNSEDDVLEWEIKSEAGKGPWKTTVDDDLLDCSWIWSNNLSDSQIINWTWAGGESITDKIWQFPDPVLYSDAVKPRGWSDGFNSFNWGGANSDAINTRSQWHSGWLGHHAKWVDGDGEFGGMAIKFIDQNSEFGAPNHIDYVGIHKTGNVPASSDQPTTLAHRWMGISQTLPHSMAAQGLQPGDNITVSWNQKSDTPNKGAQVGLHHYRKSTSGPYWGLQDRISGNNPATLEDGSNPAWEYEFSRYKPVSKVGEWERVSWTGIVEDDWDLHKASSLYIYGHYGPEGIVWVEDVKIELTTLDTSIDTTPLTADLVANIIGVDGDTATLNTTYQNLAPDGTVTNNELNIQSFSDFASFHVDYTSSFSETVPVYGSLRGDIQKIVGNSIFLVDSYAELGFASNHDFNNELDVKVDSEFNKWFIQYPNDSSQDLSKLLKTGPNTFNLISNFKIDTQTYTDYPHSIVYKLYEPLDSAINEKDFTTVVREMIPPIEETVQLFPFVEESISDVVLRSPELQNVNPAIGNGITELQSYSSLLSNDPGVKEEIENELISGSLTADINVDYSQFGNFIHFSSAEQRLRNFKYKLDLIEQYTDRSASLSGAGSGSTGRYKTKANPGLGAYLIVSESGASNPSFTPVSGSLIQIQKWETLRRDTITNFDKFEKYMFNQSSSLATSSLGLSFDNTWPKESGAGTYSSPYVNYRTSQSIASTWYDNQIISASDYDKANKNRLKSHLPMFVQDDNENDVMLKFIDMVGHHFDDLWVFIKAMTDVHDKRDKLTEGVARNLLHPVAASLGWEVHDGKDLISLPQYMLGMSVTGSEKPVEYSITPDKDISREIWSRIVSNIPYFLKTKGTTRAIKGLISCYGIPSSVLRVMEYGGPKLPGQPDDFMITRKFTKALDFFGSSNNTYVEYNAWMTSTQGDAPTDRVPDTIEFRFKAADGGDQVLVRRDGDWAIRLKDNGSTDRYGHVSFMLSGSHGYNEVSSSELPVYDGDFWSVMLTRTTKSGGVLSSDTGSQDVNYTLHTKQYDSGRSKIIYESEEVLLISGSMSAASASYNIAYSGSGTTVTIGGPEENTYFGESFSGSMMEFRNWTTPLGETSFDNHVAAPIAFDGNSPSASYLDLVTRFSFDDDKDLSVGANQWFQDASADQTYTSSAEPHNYTSGMGNHFSSVVDETKLKVANFGPSAMSSRKIRIEADERIDKVGNPVLKFGESITIPAYDNAPIDSNKLGVFFSPSAAINEDIISSFPNIDFDQYIGDPRDQYKERYDRLSEVRNLYWKKYAGPNNFWDYLRLLKYYDSSLYKQIRALIPARANATVGILIEPTLFERDKVIIGKQPTFEPQHHTTYIETKGYISESARYEPLDSEINWSNPFGINKHKMETGSYLSSSAQYESYGASLTYTDPFRVNYYTQQSGSEPGGFISSSAEELTPWGLNTIPLNFYDPFRLNNKTQKTGSGAELSAELVSYQAPSETFSQLASGTGSFVLRHILERPSLYNIGDIDESGWYGSDYLNSTIQQGSVKVIFEEVVMPRIEENVISQNNMETMYFYGTPESASLHKPNSSSFVLSDLDNKWDEAIGTNRLFYVGCVQTDNTTIVDPSATYLEDSPAFETFLVSPTKLVTGDKPNTKMEVKNK
jgi:hypothetical protein